MIKRFAGFAIAAAFLAVPSPAFADQPVTIAPTAGGYMVSVPDGWSIIGCSGMIHTTLGVFTLGADSSPAPNEIFVSGAGFWAIGATVTRIDATCSMSQTHIVEVPQTSTRTIGVDAAYWTHRSHTGNCGWHGFKWGAYYALQAWCQGGSGSKSTTTWKLRPPTGAFGVTLSSYGQARVLQAGHRHSLLGEEPRRLLHLHRPRHRAPRLRPRVRRAYLRDHRAGADG